MKPYQYVFIGLVLCLLLIGTVSADAFSEFTVYGDAWKSTNDTYTILKYNATGTHFFNTAGNETTIEYFILAGGGGGGDSAGGYATGGGGAGGFLTGTGLAVSGTETIIVGAGGSVGNNGGDSSLTNDGATKTATGGGSGGDATANGDAGGSGGGGSHQTGSTGGAGSVGQGHDGGDAANYAGGGGGGATEDGANAGGIPYGGRGGNGVAITITGTSITYAGGGGGGWQVGGDVQPGYGGTGGGGTGAKWAAYSATAGMNFLGGGGGGGGGTTEVAAAGGSGVVIIKFPTPVVVTPVASFALDKLNGTQPLTVQFTDASTNTPTSWAWGAKNLTPGNNTWFAFSTTQHPSMIFNYGNWSINLTAINAGGSNISTQITWVNVSSGAAFTSDFSGTPLTGYAPLAVDFVDMSTGDGLYDWAWNFGDTGTSALRNPSHTYTAAGSYDVKLTIKGFGGTTDTTKNNYVMVNYPFSEYTDPLGYILADGANNKINFYSFKNATDGKSIEIIVSGSYEVA